MKRLSMFAGCLLASACGPNAFDANATYTVTPLDAQVASSNNGAAWDPDNSAPDVQVSLACPGQNAAFTSAVESYQPTWSNGSCTATGAQLRDTGITWHLEDVDLTINDSITAVVTSRLSETVIRSGEADFQDVNAAKSMRFRITQN